MNNTALLAIFSYEGNNNWMLLFVATLLTGIILFAIGLYIGRRFWMRFEELSDRMHVDNKKRSAMLKKQRKHFRTIQESLEFTG